MFYFLFWFDEQKFCHHQFWNFLKSKIPCFDSSLICFILSSLEWFILIFLIILDILNSPPRFNYLKSSNLIPNSHSLDFAILAIYSFSFVAINPLNSFQTMHWCIDIVIPTKCFMNVIQIRICRAMFALLFTTN